MSKGKYIASAIIMSVAYAIGLPLFIIGIMSNGDLVLFTILGLLLCGFPTFIFSFVAGRILYTRKDSRGRTRSTGNGLKRFAICLIGLFLGLVITPICIIVNIVKAIKFKPEPSPEYNTGYVRASDEAPAESAKEESPVMPEVELLSEEKIDDEL